MNVLKRKLFYACLVLCYFSLHKSSHRRPEKYASKPTEQGNYPSKTSISMELSPTIDEPPSRQNYAALALLIIVGVFMATIILTFSAMLSVVIMLAIGNCVMYIHGWIFEPANAEGQAVVQPEQINSMIGLTIREYTCLRVIGRGRYGTVYLGSSADHKAIAMKVITKGTAPDFIILREWMVLCLAKDTNFVVQCLERLETATNHVFVMEYVSGVTLLTLLRTLEVALEEDRVRFYTSEIVTALSRLHKEGILLRDLRLENVMLDSQGHVKLIDLGSSAIGVYGNGRRLDDFRGTLACIAPEVLLHQVYGHPVDLWALGILFYELLMNKHPFLRSQELLTMRSVVRDELHLDPIELSPEAADITLRLLDKEPETRLTLPGVKIHDFFASVNWDLVVARGTKPPRLPRSINKRLIVPSV